MGSDHGFHQKEGVMLSPEVFTAIQELRRQGVGKKRVARLLKLHVQTVRKYWVSGPLEATPRDRGSLLDPWKGYLTQRAPETDYCARVLFLDIQARGYYGGYERVKLFVRPLREERRRWEEATIRFETGPGQQAQADWGSTWVDLGGQLVRIRLFVMVLGYSRRNFVRAELQEDLPALLRCHEAAFEWFGGLTETILYDNPKTIVQRRDWEGQEVVFNAQFMDFARYWGYTPRLCRPYRARTKGKVESGVKYVKHNFFGLYGRKFGSLEELNEKLPAWCGEVADERIHGTTHEKPKERFLQENLTPVSGRAPYRIEQVILRRVPTDALVMYRTNRYSVPWGYVGQEVVLRECGERLRFYSNGVEIADHPLLGSRYQTHAVPAHYEGIQSLPRRADPPEGQASVSLWQEQAEEVEVRDLALYEALVAEGGA
jgi:transposase